MDELIVTCVQQQIRVFESHEEFRGDIQRFMRLAKVKESHLVVFPELSGLLLVPPLAPGLKRTLLKMAERQIKRSPSIFDRMIGRAADSAAGAIGGISKDLADTIIQHENTLRDVYLTIFSETAREYGMYIVGGSIYLPDTLDGQVHNTAFLFNPTGDVVGQQSKVALNPVDRQFCQPAIDGLKVFETDFGELGVLIGEDVLYPENGRILAGNGAIAIVNLLAAASHGTFLKTRHALAARLQENFLLGTQSCLVGKNILGHDEPDFVGRSTVFAPMEMSSRYSGILAEVGSVVSESIVSTTWDIKGLLELRQTTTTPTFILPEDKTLRNQIGKIYGLSEDVAPSIMAVQPTAVEEQIDLLPIEHVPPEHEWEVPVTITEQVSAESDTIASEMPWAAEASGQPESSFALLSEGEEVTPGVDQQSMSDLFVEEELISPTSLEPDDIEHEELPAFAALMHDEFEEPYTVSPETETDNGWSSKLWDDSEDALPRSDSFSEPAGFLEGLRDEADSKPEQNLEAAPSVPVSEGQPPKDEESERKPPLSRLKTWWSRREKEDS